MFGQIGIATCLAASRGASARKLSIGYTLGAAEECIGNMRATERDIACCWFAAELQWQLDKLARPNRIGLWSVGPSQASDGGQMQMPDASTTLAHWPSGIIIIIVMIMIIMPIVSVLGSRTNYVSLCERALWGGGV